MKPLYAKDWHQCIECLCVRPDKELRKLRVLDDVLKLEHEVHRCLDTELCGRLKKGRQEQLDRDRGLSPTVPIRTRKAHS